MLNQRRFQLATLLWLSVALFTCIGSVEGITQTDGRTSTVSMHRDQASGHCTLRLQRTLTQPVHFLQRSLWRYDVETKTWQLVKSKKKQATVTVASSAKPGTVVLELPPEIGLYWVEWTENEIPFQQLATVGPVLCNDLNIGKPPQGMIVACVPAVDHATAMFVPAPALNCRLENDGTSKSNVKALLNDSPIVVVGVVSRVRNAQTEGEHGPMRQQFITVEVTAVLKGQMHARRFDLFSNVDISRRTYQLGEAGVWFLGGFEKANLASLVDPRRGFAKIPD